ncbi:hypothetical protein, partial [Acidovorax sp. A1169]|uniref:hypothetical protein n=1 Tax=Acidovorax sp. A1169 TaxID=3059524 RepID=UPI0027377CCA
LFNVKNIQIIDGADNCVFDIFQASDDEFSVIFKKATDIAFIDEIYEAGDSKELDDIFSKIWKRPIKKIDAMGIHGIIFYELGNKKIYYPTRRDSEACNPDGSKLR